MEEVEEENVKRLAVVELVEKLEGSSLEARKAAVASLRLLAKCDDASRRYIAEANGIERLLPLLHASDDKVQENAITTILNLSIQPDNRIRITQTYGALDGILDVLRCGLTSEVRENAAATLFSLLIVEEYREVVGQQPGAIPALVALLREATTHRGKKDAIKVLFHLSLHNANKPRVIAAGGLHLLLSFLHHKRAGLLEESLAVLAVLALCQEGVEAMIEQVSVLATLVNILSSSGSTPRAKENSVAVLLAMCETGGEEVVERTTYYNHRIVGTLCSLLVVGSDRAKRKAKSLMRLLVVTDSPLSSCTTTLSSNRFSF